MSIDASDYFEVRLIDDVTVVRLRDVAEHGCRASNDFDLAPLIHHMRDLPLPPPPEIWQQFKRDLMRLLETSRPRQLVIDFANLDRIGCQPIFSTAMNSVYAEAKRRSAQFDCRWRLCGFTAKARAFYDASCLRTLFPEVDQTQAEAVAAFRETPSQRAE